MVRFVVLAALATLVAFLISMAESAFQRMSRVRAEELEAEGRPGAQALVRVVGDTAAYLSVLTFLRVIAESVVAVMVTLAAVDAVEGTVQPFLVAIGVMALISFAVVGVSPGPLGRPHSARVALRAASLATPTLRAASRDPEAVLQGRLALPEGRKRLRLLWVTLLGTW